LLAFLRSSDFTAHHETLARASRLPNAASWVNHFILQSAAGINRSNQYITENHSSANLAFRSTSCQSISTREKSISGGASSSREPQPTRNPITTFQAPSIDRLHGHVGLSFGDHDSQIVITLGTGALKVLGHSALSRSQAFVHRDPRKFQPEPFRQFFDAYGELLKLKARDLHD
jgi:hypothetical protein